MNRYILKITGKRLDTFILLLIRLKINFTKIKETKDYLIIELLEEDYNKLAKIKTTYKIEILKRKGLIYFTHVLKVRKLFLFISLLGFLFLIFLTNIIFSVNIIETDEELRNTIMEDLKELGIKKYNFKVDYKKKEEIEKKILEKEKDILEWLEIEEKGVTYEVKLIKRVKDDTKKETEPRNIIANKSGMITRIEAESSEKLNEFKNSLLN